MAKVFISYHRDDADFAELVRARLQEAGLTPWLDQDRLRAGADWRDEIDYAIKDSAALVLLLTPEASRSEYVSYEWAFALGAGVTVIPLRLRPVQSHPRLEALQYVDFTDRKRPWDELLKALGGAVASQNGAPVRLARDAPAAVKKAFEMLDDVNPDAQSSAVSALAQMDHPAAFEVLVGALRHPVANVRIHAAMVLADRKDPRALPGLLEGQRLWQLRYEFVRKAARLGATAVPGLIAALRDQNTEVREYSVRALTEIGDAAAGPPLSACLGDRDSKVRLAAVEALDRLADRSAMAELQALLGDPAAEVRAATVVALGHLAGSGVIPQILERLQDTSPAVRERAVTVLADVAPAVSLPRLVEMLDDRDREVGKAAYDALMRIGTPEAKAAAESKGKEWEIKAADRLKRQGI